uniref:Uncharacterized protein n=1 Tax=Globodera rostochiensis TaxID=31243 RepID=A0A914HP64_GLORO
MEEFWILILVLFIATNSLDKAESVELEEMTHKTFDEIFGEGWWDKGEAEDLKTPAPTNFGQNVHHQIDRQNTQIGQIEPNSTDQNPPLTESDHSDNAEDERKRKIVDKFLAMRNEFKQIGKYSAKEWAQIENEISTHLEVNRKKIYKWKKEFGLSQKVFYKKEERKNLVKKFDQMKAELKRAGFKNSYQNQIDETVAKELGLAFSTIYKWKRKLGQTKPNKHPHSKQMELMKHYYEIKNQNHKITDENIAKMLKIGTTTLYKWKKQFEQQHLHQNSVDGHSVEENAAANVEKIENPNSGII